MTNDNPLFNSFRRGQDSAAPPKRKPSRVEYKQDTVRADKGRFDNILNDRAQDGWKVEHIAQTSAGFLVTYSRLIPTVKKTTTTHTTTVSKGQAQLDDDLNKMIMQGYELHHFSSVLEPLTSNMGFSNSLLCTCVWRRSQVS